MMHGTHDTALVVLSIIVAVLASYTALDLAGRIRAATTRSGSIAWLATAGAAMGGGIWSMHFIAMLAFSMPGMEAYYDPGLTVISLVLAVVVTGAGFAVVSRWPQNLVALLLSGLFMGLGIVGMHYTGMAAMRMPVTLSYDALWVSISVLIAVGASVAALWLAFSYTGPIQKFTAAIAMGLAVSGMHFAGMQAATFTAHHSVDQAQGSASLGQASLALSVAATTFLVLFLALIAAMFDRRFARLAEKEAAALRRSEELFRGLYRKTPLPLHALDQQGRLEEVSDAWLEMLGYEQREVIGQPLAAFMTPESARQRDETDWPKLLEQGELKEIEYRVVRKNGDILNVLSTARVEYDPSGNFLWAIGGLVDVTARRRAEEALLQSQKIEALGQLTGGVAHDFNNLLAVILGNLDLLRKRLPDDPKTRRMLDNAIEGVRRGTALTQRMLSFARQQSLAPQPINVLALVRGMEDLLQRSLGPQIRVETHFPLGLASAQADPHQLELALLNLTVNARDAMPTGGLITISGREETIGSDTIRGLAGGTYVCLSVRDTGEGMDAETLSRAREPFFTTKEIGKGTGLGLSMVHGFAEQSGGALVLESERGKGTAAEIWLPRAAAAASQEQRESGPAPQPSTPTKLLRILVVDDDALVLMNTEAMLEDMGHQVVSSTSGSRALEIISQETIDLVVTDYAMPGMTGTQLVSQIRQQREDIPAILATGYADIPGGDDLKLPRLAKPFTEAQLAQAIASLFPGKGPQNIVKFHSKPAR